MQTIRIVVADDSAIVRRGMRSLIEKHLDLRIVSEAGDGFEAVNCVEEHRPDILLLDMSMPVLDGIGVLKELAARGLTVAVLVVSAYTDWQFIQNALTWGAAGYVTKEDAPVMLADLIRRAKRGERGLVSSRIRLKNP